MQDLQHEKVIELEKNNRLKSSISQCLKTFTLFVENREELYKLEEKQREKGVIQEPVKN